jgi:xylulokinase
MDVRKAAWSPATLAYVGMPANKLPALGQAGTVVGTVSRSMAESLGLPLNVKIVLGAHDQPTSALGCGAIQPGMASYTIGSYICITPAYDTIPPATQMIAAGLNVEHHAVAGLYVSFMYNATGGSLLKWFRDTFARLERAEAQASGRDIYDLLLAEMPAEPTDLLVLPHFAPTGPPDFDPNPTGLIAGLTLETTRGQIIKGLLEGLTYYFRVGFGVMEDAGIHIREYRVAGGGARSDAWMQIKADILGKQLVRPKNVDASALGAAILAGIGSGLYQSAQQAVDSLVQIDRVFEPDPRRQRQYDERFVRYKLLYPFSQSLR